MILIPYKIQMICRAGHTRLGIKKRLEKVLTIV